MGENILQSEKKSQSFLKWVALVVLIAALVCALWVNFGLRAPVEAQDSTVGLFVDYDELWRIANTSLDIDFHDMMRKAHLAGATGLVVRERVLSDWEIAGEVIVLAGGQLRFQIELAGGNISEWSEHQINPDGTYILTRDPMVHEQIFSILDAKRRHPTSFEFQDYMVIGTSLHSVERANLGLGFPIAQLERAAEMGYYILPRIRTWDPVTENNLAVTMGWVSQIPNLAAIGFNDSTVPGGGLDPLIQDLVADSLIPLDKPLVSFEFFDQVGLGGVATRLDNGFMRVHAIAENELRDYLDFQDAADRFVLAATERNMRFIYLRFHGLMNPAASMELNMEFIEFIREALENAGLTVGVPVPISDFSIPYVALLIIGAGIIASGGWLLAMIFQPFVKRKKWIVLLFILTILALGAWGVGLVILPAIARKLFAFAASIIFPCLGVIMIIENSDKLPFSARAASGSCKIKKLIHAALQLLFMSSITFAGGLIVSGLLSEPVFMIKLDNFVGVTLSQIATLMLIPLVLWMRETNWFGLLQGTVKSNVKFWQFGISLIMLAAFTLFIIRTGNDNPEAVLDLELMFRQILHDILGVRPRTSEFLIGHPLMLVLLYYGYKFNKFPLLIAGIMGQVSLMNTYAHVHTPIVISVIRTAHGLWMGTVIGIVIILILEFVFKRVKILQEKYPTSISFS